MIDSVSLHASLHAAVKARLDIIADHAFRDRDTAAHLEALKNAAAHLDSLIQSLPGDTDPTLRHYLERQSYTKALAWLDDRLG